MTKFHLHNKHLAPSCNLNVYTFIRHTRSSCLCAFAKAKRRFLLLFLGNQREINLRSVKVHQRCETIFQKVHHAWCACERVLTEQSTSIKETLTPLMKLSHANSPVANKTKICLWTRLAILTIAGNRVRADKRAEIFHALLYSKYSTMINIRQISSKHPYYYSENCMCYLRINHASLHIEDTLK